MIPSNAQRKKRWSVVHFARRTIHHIARYPTREKNRWHGRCAPHRSNGRRRDLIVGAKDALELAGFGRGYTHGLGTRLGLAKRSIAAQGDVPRRAPHTKYVVGIARTTLDQFNVGQRRKNVSGQRAVFASSMLAPFELRTKSRGDQRASSEFAGSAEVQFLHSPAGRAHRHRDTLAEDCPRLSVA